MLSFLLVCFLGATVKSIEGSFLYFERYAEADCTSTLIVVEGVVTDFCHNDVRGFLATWDRTVVNDTRSFRVVPNANISGFSLERFSDDECSANALLRQEFVSATDVNAVWLEDDCVSDSAMTINSSVVLRSAWNMPQVDLMFGFPFFQEK